jgi:hypothetical protein
MAEETPQTAGAPPEQALSQQQPTLNDDDALTQGLRVLFQRLAQQQEREATREQGRGL